MAAVDSGQPRGAAAKAKGKKKRAKRIGVRMDMTPMVDVAFLLLTFFMFATTLTQPQVMEITMPPNTENVKVPESDLFNLVVRADGALFWCIGRNPLERVESARLRGLLVERNKENSKLITSLRFDRKASYQRLVDMLDEINIAEGELIMSQAPGVTRERRFSLSTMSAEDSKGTEGK
jgi:biopolymer transport protein ExbD